MSRGNLFDDISRVVASPVSRRQAMTRILGALAGVAAVPLWPGRARADVACPPPFPTLRCASLVQCCMVNGRPGCCPSMTRCAGGRCCPLAQACGSLCCQPILTCLGGTCCPPLNVCGPICCRAPKRCDRTGTLPQCV